MEDGQISNIQGQIELKSQINNSQNKHYPTVQGVTTQNSSNFNQMIIPSASSKRSHKMANSGALSSSST